MFNFGDKTFVLYKAMKGYGLIQCGQFNSNLKGFYLLHGLYFYIDVYSEYPWYTYQVLRI